jgi:hypothetical protein
VEALAAVVVMTAGSIRAALPSPVRMTGVGTPDGHPNAGATVTGFIQLTDDDAGADVCATPSAGPNPGSNGVDTGKPGFWSPKRDVCCASVSKAAVPEPALWDAEKWGRRANAPSKASEVGGRVRGERASGCGSGRVLRLAV